MALIFVFVVASSFTAALPAAQEPLPNPNLPPPPQLPDDKFVAPRPATDRTVWELFNVSDPGPEFWEARRKISSNSLPYASYRHNDMVVPEDSDRVGWTDNAFRWPGGLIPVWIDPRWSEQALQIITKGLEKITTTTCIRFERYNPYNPNHSRFVRLVPWYNEGCRAMVGRWNMPEGQWVRMDPRGCIVEGTVAHEFIHTIGFWHEHQRPDRDDWISIQYDNIPQERWSDFNQPPDVSIFGTTYDYGSIMHYPANLDWAINPDLPIMVSKTDTPVAGQEKELTDLDIQKIQNMYKGICN